MIIYQLELIDIYRTFYHKTMNFIFFSSALGTFSRIDHILGDKSSLNKFKIIEIIPSILSDHIAVRLGINYRRKIIKNSNIWWMKSMLLNNQQITEEIKKVIRICIEINENENTTQNLSVQFSCSVMSDSLQTHESQPARPPCPSPSPGVHSDSHPSSQ